MSAAAVHAFDQAQHGHRAGARNGRHTLRGPAGVHYLADSTDEVAAFEELIGCHGGLGGWPTRPVLVHPRDWPIQTTLDGADAVHHQVDPVAGQIRQLAGLPSSGH